MSNEKPLPDFKSIGNAAVEREVGSGAAPVAPVTPVAPAVTPSPVITPVVTEPITPGIQTPNPVAPVQPTGQVAVPGQAPVVQGDPTFEVDFGNGKVEKLTQAQIREGFLRQQDYTKKTTDVANNRKQLETAAQQLAQYNQEVAFARQLLANPQFAQQWAQSQLGPQVPQVPVDPNTPLTVADAQTLVNNFRREIQQVQQSSIQEVQKAQQLGQQYVEDRMQVADYGEKINQTLSKTFNELPVLKVRPEFEDIIRYRVAQAAPESIDDTLKAFDSISREFARELDQHYQGRQVQQQQQVTNLATTGIELPGGSAPPVEQQKFVKAGKLDWKGLQSAVKSQYDPKG
jgi:hypothetical protein